MYLRTPHVHVNNVYAMVIARPLPAGFDCGIGTKGSVFVSVAFQERTSSICRKVEFKHIIDIQYIQNVYMTMYVQCLPGGVWL